MFHVFCIIRPSKYPSQLTILGWIPIVGDTSTSVYNPIYNLYHKNNIVCMFVCDIGSYLWTLAMPLSNSLFRLTFSSPTQLLTLRELETSSLFWDLVKHESVMGKKLVFLGHLVVYNNIVFEFVHFVVRFYVWLVHTIIKFFKIV
jgi:hypothetical protein